MELVFVVVVGNKAGIWLAGSLQRSLPGDVDGEKAEA